MPEAFPLELTGLLVNNKHAEETERNILIKQRAPRSGTCGFGYRTVLGR